MEWEPLSDDDKYQMMEKLFLAIEKGAITKDDGIENFVREMFKLEQREQTEDDRAGGSGPPKPPTPTERDKPDTDEIETAPGEDEPSIAQHTAGQSGRPIIQFVAPAKLRRSLTKYEQKVDFESLIRLTNESHDMFVSNWMGIIRTQHDGLLKWIRKKMVVENSDTKAVQAMKIPRVLDMRNSLQKYLLVGLYFGAIQAQHETKRGGKYSADQLRFAAFDLAKMPVTEIEKHFAKRGLELSPAIKAAAREIIRESFFITGVETEKILNQAKAVLMNGIRRGDRIWAEGELARVFDQYLQTGELVNGQLSTAHRIETIARTNFTTSINEGRRAKFTEPGVDEFVMAYQWSSVLDDATTPYCAAMDGRVLRKAELNAEGWPPAHYNCRSLVVPIVEGEEFIIDKIPGGVDRGVGFTAFQYVAEIHPSCVCHSERRN
jgi:SPP1 gp7 family putative phage head morphogenesis protein